MDYRGFWIEKTRAGYIATKRGEETITDPDPVGITRRIDEYLAPKFNIEWNDLHYLGLTPKRKVA